MTTLLETIRTSNEAAGDDGIFLMLQGYEDASPTAQAVMIIDLAKTAYRLGYEAGREDAEPDDTRCIECLKLREEKAADRRRTDELMFLSWMRRSEAEAE